MAHSIEEQVELTAKQQLQQAGVDFQLCREYNQIYQIIQRGNRYWL